MIFKEFAKRLGSVIQAESSTHAFVHTLFESIIPENRYDVFDEYSESTFKAYYNGNAKISRIAKKINIDAQAENFADFINHYEDTAVQKICDAFSDVIPDINCVNAGQKLGELFESIISEAASAKKKGTQKSAGKSAQTKSVHITDETETVPDYAEYEDGIFHTAEKNKEDTGWFQKFIDGAYEYYSAKKTLLYAEKPHPFYSLYVCNDLRYHKQRMTDLNDQKPEFVISNASAEILENESKYIVIQGTGGIGKSMLLTHLFLSSAEKYKLSGRLPILISLKDYKEDTAGIIELAWNAVKEYDPSMPQKHIIRMLEEKRIILLLDGLDEIQSSLRDAFNKDLDAFIKAYSGNTVFITSRPVYAFISYAKFSIFDIEPLSKSQALSLINKLEFWDEKAKRDFMTALDSSLYISHTQFASNPLLLTIMLMTYSAFGEVPAKMHVFYSKAYETMSRLHDATKGSYKRPLYTGLTPEEFAKYFAQFCARTYTNEILEFTDITFADYMNKVIQKIPNTREIKAKDFLLDLTDNLCIMYHEGGKYYFIHRSFQEYFTAVYFAADFEDKLMSVGEYFEGQQHRSYSDRTFDMLYDMIPEKVERFIFLPFLKNMFAECGDAGYESEYWGFLENQYPCIYHEEGSVGETFFNEPQSFIYRFFADVKGLSEYLNLDYAKWPNQINLLPTTTWVSAYKKFTDSDAYEEYPRPERIPEEELESETIVDEDDLPYQYSSYFGDPDMLGYTTKIEICDLIKNPSKYKQILDFMKSDGFPLAVEYYAVKEYFDQLNNKTQREKASKALFDD